MEFCKKGPLFWLATITILGAPLSCTTPDRGSPMSLGAETTAYKNFVAGRNENEQKQMRRSLENFFEAVRTDVLTPRAKTLETQYPTLAELKSGEDSTWFVSFFETLVGTSLMAQSNSFRSYKNMNCYESFVRPLASSPFPPAMELMSLNEFMKAGPRIPDENTYVQQVKLFCGRRAINTFQGLDTARLSKIYLSLKHNLVLQKKILFEAGQEATRILQAYRESL